MVKQAVFTTNERDWSDDYLIAATVEDLTRAGYCVLVKYLGENKQMPFHFDFELSAEKV